MSKKIILCLDGTGNQYKEDNSNVLKLYRVIERIPHVQLVYYDAGVGTLADPHYKIPLVKKIRKLAGLAFGTGILRNIQEAYIYLMNNYEEGDQIYIFGFSRGAYTARTLAALINSCGLLEKGNESLLPYALTLFKEYNLNQEALPRFKHIFGRTCTIELLGLWDSVSTIGWIYNYNSFAYTLNNKSVKAIRHALAIDEQRIFYQPVLWGKEYQDQQDIKEVWFAGVHSDVGGGYPEKESGLSKVSLKWMINEITKNSFAIQISQKKYERYVLETSKRYVAVNSLGMQHNSLTIPWKMVQVLPYRDEEHIQKIGLWFNRKYIRKISEGSILHSSVFDRLEQGTYNPSNIILKRDKYIIEP